jgi:hypothetical protein
MPHLLRSHSNCSAALVLLLISGCSRTVAPEDARDRSLFGMLAGAPVSESTVGDARANASSGFYPLEIGGRWHYHGLFAGTLTPIEGTPSSAFEVHSTVSRALVCVEDHDGRAYVVERVEDVQDGHSSFQWIRYRQNPSGLYELDIPIGTPSTCEDATALDQNTELRDTSPAIESAWRRALQAQAVATRPAYLAASRVLEARMALLRAELHGIGASPSSTGPAPSRGAFEPPPPTELQRLAYPLRPGGSWIIRESPRFAATVERVEALDLGFATLSGWRIRYTSEFFGPRDLVQVWYGRSGLLMLSAHLESDATDESGRVIGTLTSDLVVTLDELTLPGPGRF